MSLDALTTAAALIAGADPALLRTVALSLQVSGTATDRFNVGHSGMIDHHQYRVLFGERIQEPSFGIQHPEAVLPSNLEKGLSQVKHDLDG